MADFPTLPDARSGDPLSVGPENLIRRAIRERVFGLKTPAPAESTRSIPAILTTRGSPDGFFGWDEAAWDGAKWAKKTDGITHADLDYAFEASGLKAIPLGSQFPVLIRRSRYIRTGVAGNESLAWEFDASRPWIWAKLTGHALLDGNKSRYKYAWTEVVRSADEWVAPSWTPLSGTTSTGYAVNAAEAFYTSFANTAGAPVRPADLATPVVALYETLNADGTRSYTFNWTGDSLLVVKVTNDSGVAGSATENCTLTYTVSDRFGNTLGTGLTPHRPRYDNCEYDIPASGSAGLAYYDESGDLKLYEACQEKPKGDVVTVQTDYRIDTATKKFQKKTRSVLVLEAGTESDWTDVHTGTDCE